jgi:hypothetical protein
MEDTERTLVIFLTMHRSGSSLAASIFQALGMSLGPFDLVGATPGNPHGHFESMAFLELNKDVQKLVYGFTEDLPESAEAVRKFVESDGAGDWPEIPEELLGRGRALIESLLASGRVAGFKDPRTVLLWPYWERVLSNFPAVRIVPVALLRSPHEIAMSLFTRRDGECGYWTCLDMAGVHLRRLQTIVRAWSEPIPRVRFGGVEFFDDLEPAARVCGLEWDTMTALRIFDGTCVHHVPAVVSHRAQSVYADLCGAGTRSPDAQRNAAQLEADGRARDELQLGRLRAAKEFAGQLTSELRQTHERLDQVAEQTRQALARVEEAQADVRRVTEEYEVVLNCSRQATEAYRLLYEEQRQRLEEQRLVCEEQRNFIEKLEGHPVFGRVLRGRRRLKRAFLALTSSAAGL